MESPNNTAGNAANQNNLQDNDTKYGKLYNVIDAFIETTNLAPNRKNAIKHGVRAIGEILSEFPHEEHEQEMKTPEKQNRAPLENTGQENRPKTQGRG
jgi:hypothetical protein